MQRLEFRAMGSRILAIADSDTDVPELDELPTIFERWEQALSRFRVDSELCRLNAAAGSSQPVSPVLWEVLRSSLAAAKWTDGLVTPVLLDHLVEAGYSTRSEYWPEAFKAIGSFADMQPPPYPVDIGQSQPLPKLMSDFGSRTVCLPAGVGLDFGGIAKGWSALQAATQIAEIAPALVSAGGDIAVSGPRANGDPWPIDVEDPWQEGKFLETLYLAKGGVATSGRDHRRWILSGKAMHHVIDPRSGTPARTDLITVTVLASSVLRAEALAKAVLILGADAGMEWIENQPDAAALAAHQSGTVLYSRRLESYL